MWWTCCLRRWRAWMHVSLFFCPSGVLLPPVVSSRHVPDVNRQQWANICFTFYTNVRREIVQDILMFYPKLKQYAQVVFNGPEKARYFYCFIWFSVLKQVRYRIGRFSFIKIHRLFSLLYDRFCHKPCCLVSIASALMSSVSLPDLRSLISTEILHPKVLGALFCWRERPHDCEFISLSPGVCNAASSLSFHCIGIRG